MVSDRYRVCLYCGDREGERGGGGWGTDIRDFIFWEGWFRLGDLRTYIGDVNIGGRGVWGQIWGMFILWGWGSFGTDVGDVNIVGGKP